MLFGFSLQSQCLLDSVVIRSILIDPSGGPFSYDTNGDNEVDSNDEFVEICNVSDQAVDVTGWVLSDDDPPPYPDFSFPAGSVLGSGECLIAVANYCPNLPADQCVTPIGIVNMGFQFSGFLSNSGDVVTLTDGEESCSVVYGSTTCESIDTLDIPPFDIMNCDNWGMDIDGCPLLELGDSCEYVPRVLPLEFLDFYGFVNDNNEAELNWITTSEVENLGFDILWKDNIDNDFNKVGYVDAIGIKNTVNYYSFNIDQLSPGTNYFRIKQKDLNGGHSFSKTIVLNFQSESLEWFPNPVSNVLTIKGISKGESFYIYNALGERMDRLIAQEGATILDVSTYTKGLYFIVTKDKWAKTPSFIKI